MNDDMDSSGARKETHWECSVIAEGILYYGTNNTTVACQIQPRRTMSVTLTTGANYTALWDLYGAPRNSLPPYDCLSNARQISYRKSSRCQGWITRICGWWLNIAKWVKWSWNVDVSCKGLSWICLNDFTLAEGTFSLFTFLDLNPSLFTSSIICHTVNSEPRDNKPFNYSRPEDDRKVDGNSFGGWVWSVKMQWWNESSLVVFFAIAWTRRLIRIMVANDTSFMRGNWAVQFVNYFQGLFYGALCKCVLLYMYEIARTKIGSAEKIARWRIISNINITFFKCKTERQRFLRQLSQLVCKC